MRLLSDETSYIDFIYELNPETYLVDFQIKATGMQTSWQRMTMSILTGVSMLVNTNKVDRLSNVFQD